MIKGIIFSLVLSIYAYQVLSFCILNKLDKSITIKAEWPDKKDKENPCKKGAWTKEVKPKTEECCSWVDKCCANATNAWTETKINYNVGCHTASVKFPADGIITFKKAEEGKVNVTQYDEKYLPMEDGNYLVC